MKGPLFGAARNGGGMAFERVLVAVRGDKSDEDAVKLACDLVRPTKGRVFLLYVIQVERSLPVDAEVIPETARGEQVLKRMEGLLREHRCASKAELLQAREMGPAVVQEAVEREVGAVVLGVCYKRRYGSFSLGDAVPYVLRNAPCPVILWRDAVNQLPGNGKPQPFEERPSQPIGAVRGDAAGARGF